MSAALADPEFAALALEMLGVARDLLRFELPSITETTVRLHGAMVHTAYHQTGGGYSENPEFSDTYAAVEFDGLQLFRNGQWLLAGPWQQELPELARQHTLMLKAQLAAKQQALEEKQFMQQQQARREEELRQQRALSRWNTWPSAGGTGSGKQVV